MQQTINNQQQEQATTSENQEAQQPTANNHKKQTPRITREDCCTVVCRFLFADEVWCCCGRYYHPDVSLLSQLRPNSSCVFDGPCLALPYQSSSDAAETEGWPNERTHNHEPVMSCKLWSPWPRGFAQGAQGHGRTLRRQHPP